MEKELRNCQNCKQDFAVESEDFQFYEKIGVPPPTFCPDCRLQRRMTYRNERNLYKRKDNLSREDIISCYSPEKPFVVYSAKNWWGDGWDPLTYGVDYDFSEPFFQQFRNLLGRVPLLGLSNFNSTNSDYCNFVDSNKNCYLIFASGYNENVCYSNRTQSTKDSMDLLVANKNELCYESINCFECFRLHHSSNCKNCSDSYFLYNCRNCNNCFGCTNLVNKSYHIFNEPYSKEDYFKKLEESKVDTREGIKTALEKFKNIYLKSIHRYGNIVGSTQVTGDNVNNSKNCHLCFDVLRNVEDSKFIQGSLETKDNYDGLGQYKHELCYENVDNDMGGRNIGTITVYNSNNTHYSFNCHSCENLFGCSGLRNKQYCILNKQYTKEAYEKLVPEIIEHMNTMPFVDKKGRVHKYGEFFPTELSPFAYNETIAQEYFPLSKEEVSTQGYKWKESETRDYKITKKPEEIPDRIKDIDDSILGEVISCEHEGKCNEQCTTAFKIIPQELQFYKKLNLPLPRLCPNCRHYQRLKQRNPLKLWHRTCMCDYQIFPNTAKHLHHPEGKCSNEFETSYSPDRKEIIYCEQCYQAEVV